MPEVATTSVSVGMSSSARKANPGPLKKAIFPNVGVRTNKLEPIERTPTSLSKQGKSPSNLTKLEKSPTTISQ